MTASKKSRRAPRDQPVISIVRTLDGLLQVMAVRAIVYAGEQRCPYEEEFDGNDFAGATHLLARVEMEPAGVLRMRWFAGFAKAERAAVLDRFRGHGIAFALMDEALRLAARKGYARVIGQVEPALLRFWRRRSDVTRRTARPAVTFSDRTYVEVLFQTPPMHALSIDSPGIVLNRPEGAWDAPSVLDRSATRSQVPAG